MFWKKSCVKQSQIGCKAADSNRHSLTFFASDFTDSVSPLHPVVPAVSLYSKDFSVRWTTVYESPEASAKWRKKLSANCQWIYKKLIRCWNFSVAPGMTIQFRWFWCSYMLLQEFDQKPTQHVIITCVTLNRINLFIVDRAFFYSRVICDALCDPKPCIYIYFEFSIPVIQSSIFI